MASDEVWNLYEGGPLELLVAPPDMTSLDRVVLAGEGAGFQPTYTVPAGWWQAAKSLGSYALAGCTVGPGFTFDDFEFAAACADDRERLAALSPDSRDLL